MDAKQKGAICGIVSAVCYGTNPLGALFLYQVGVNTNSVLFYRFSIAALMLGGLLLFQKESFRITVKELLVLGILGVLFASSSLSLFYSFHYMDAGVASTLLFVYPVMVAVMMALFFKERISVMAVVSILLALGGIALLYKSGSGMPLSAVGVSLVMVSSLTYAVYIIVVNRSSMVISPIKMTFYVLLFCMLTIVLHSFVSADGRLQWLATPSSWLLAVMLALIPTVFSLILMVVSVHSVGSTPTAIMGALEPLTAVIIGVTVFNETFSARLGLGIILILSAVILIVLGKSFSPHTFTSVLSRVGHAFRRHWWWK